MWNYLEQFVWELNPDYSVLIEADERVSYGYLLKGKEIIGDVWLFNIMSTPVNVDWRNKEEMPFLNPIGLAQTQQVKLSSTDLQDIEVEWAYDNTTDIVTASIYLRMELFAVLQSNALPGWCINAKKNGPLSKCFDTLG